MIAHTDKPIRHHLAEDTIDAADVDALIAWLKTYPRLTKGPKTPEFESAFSRWLGVPHSLFCNSGSSANLLMYYAMLRSGRLRNRKVIVPSVGWVTTVAPALQLGFEPFMCEADGETFGLDLEHLESLLKKHEPALVVMVQVLGVPHKMDELMRLKDRHGFLLLEDACAAAGAEYKGRKVGGFGDMASFSAYFGHQFSTIEGGLVSTSDRELFDLLLMHRSHGWSKDLEPPAHEALVRKHEIDDFHTPFVFYEPGFNLRATDLQAVLGLRQIDKLDWMVRRRRENHAQFSRRLAGALSFQKPPPGSQTCSISFGALARDGAQRKRIVAALAGAGIETRVFSAGNLGLHPFWTERYGKTSFPVADRVHHCGFFLPNNPSLSAADVNAICDVVLGSL